MQENKPAGPIIVRGPDSPEPISRTQFIPAPPTMAGVWNPEQQGLGVRIIERRDDADTVKELREIKALLKATTEKPAEADKQTLPVTERFRQTEDYKMCYVGNRTPIKISSDKARRIIKHVHEQALLGTPIVTANALLTLVDEPKHSLAQIFKRDHQAKERLLTKVRGGWRFNPRLS